VHLASRVVRVGGGAPAALLVLLVGCSKPPSDDGRREATFPAAPPLAQHAPRQVVHTAWSFDSGTDECVGTAAAGGTSLRVTVRRNAPIRLVVSLTTKLERRPAGPAAVPLRFSGPTGSWQVSAQQTASHQLAVTLGSDDTALSRVLVLLGGGVLNVGEPEQAGTSLGITPSDAQGQLWFDCARSKMI
jgi:hypothetical protein